MIAFTTGMQNMKLLIAFCLLVFAPCLCTNIGGFFNLFFINISELVLKFSSLAYFLYRSFTYVLQALGDGQEHLRIITWAEESCLCPCPTKIRNNCICAMLRQSQGPCFALGGLSTAMAVLTVTSGAPTCPGYICTNATRVCQEPLQR